MEQGTIDFVKWLFQTYGPLVVFMLFQAWRDWKREQKLGERLDTIQDKNTQALLTVISENTKALSQNAEANRQSNDASKETTRCVQSLTQTIAKLEVVISSK